MNGGNNGWPAEGQAQPLRFLECPPPFLRIWCNWSQDRHFWCLKLYFYKWATKRDKLGLSHRTVGRIQYHQQHWERMWVRCMLHSKIKIPNRVGESAQWLITCLACEKLWVSSLAPPTQPAETKKHHKEHSVIQTTSLLDWFLFPFALAVTTPAWGKPPQQRNKQWHRPPPILEGRRVLSQDLRCAQCQPGQLGGQAQEPTAPGPSFTRGPGLPTVFCSCSQRSIDGWKHRPQNKAYCAPFRNGLSAFKNYE